jgi:hypothetical protein
MLEVKRLASAMIAAAAVAACSGGDDGGTEPTKAISISLSSAALSVTQGTTGTVSVNLTRSGGFTGDVAVTVEGLPGTVNFTAAPATIGASATSTILTFAAAGTAVPGVINATVRATGTGVTAATAPLAITVVAAPTPTYTLALANATVTATQGGTATQTVNLTRTNFTGAVALTAEGLPTGVTAAFNPASVTGTTSTLTLTAAAGATTGTSTVTVKGTATGIADKTATFQLTVNAASAGGFTLSMTPATLPVTQGANGTSTVNITRTGGFAGSVNLTASGLPNGVTAAFNPTDATGNTSTLTLTASATAATGPATVTIKGTSAGQTDQTTTLGLTVNAAAGYTLAVNEETVTAAAGATGTANITLTRTGGFTGAVALTAEGLPTGVTAAFNPASVTGTTSVLTLTVAANATPGTSTITVRGTSTGQTDKTATFQLTITAAAGGYTLSMTPATLTVQQGTSGTSTVNITRTGAFAGAVTLAATGLPNGVTAAFNPAAPTGNTSTLTLTATGTATTGAATVTITGTATGLANQTTTLALTVSAATGGSGNTTWEFCTVSQTPIWVAIQDGASGTWTRVTPSGPNNTRFQFNITQPKGAIAYVTTPASGGVGTARTFAARLSADLQQTLLLRNRPTRANAYAASSLAGNFTLSIFYGTQAELNATGTTRCLAGSGKTVNGSVAGLSSGATSQQSATISLGSASASASAQQLTFQLKDVPDGALDLIAGRQTTTINPNDFTFTIALDKLIIRRGVNAAANSTLPVLDFGSAEAFDPAQANLTLANLGTDIGYTITSYFTASGSGTTGAALSTFPSPGAGPFKYYGVPSNKQAAGDLHLAIAFAIPSLTNTSQSRFAALYFKDPTDRTMTLGAAFPAPTITTAATAPYVRFRAQGTLPTEYNQFFSISYNQAQAGRNVAISASQNYLAGATTFDFTIPDFTAVAGWDNNWGPIAGQSTTWSVTGYSFTGSFNTATPTEGSTFKGGSRNGTLTP